MKRAFDVFFSIIIIISFSPIFLITSILIKIENFKLPVLFIQIRTGRNNIPFKIYKFRSMINLDDNKNSITIGQDSRITKIGKYIRKFKIDELPQFFNVLIGNMSVVGPRPEIPEFTQIYNDEQLTVLSLKPGITDHASIKYFNESKLLANSNNPSKTYAEKIMPEKLNLNIEYVKNHSIYGDIKIILFTVIRVFK
tara:strand:+ start:1015 stop:1602 length:588 start_codon:yes stop_codon:yes gene_type:complete